MSYRFHSRNNNETSLEMAAGSSALPCSGCLCRINTPLTGHMQGLYFQQLLYHFWCVSGKQQVSIYAASLFGCYLHKLFPTCPSPSQEMAKLTLSSHQEAPRSIFQQLAQKILHNNWRGFRNASLNKHFMPNKRRRKWQFPPSFWGKLEGHPANQAVSWFPSLDKRQPTQTCFYTPPWQPTRAPEQGHGGIAQATCWRAPEKGKKCLYIVR